MCLFNTYNVRVRTRIVADGFYYWRDERSTYLIGIVASASRSHNKETGMTVCCVDDI